jgi:Sec-independent protein translocase protein TatA
MNLSFSQIILILIVGFLLFGNLPQKLQEIAKGLRLAKKELEKENQEKKKDKEENSLSGRT